MSEEYTNAAQLGRPPVVHHGDCLDWLRDLPECCVDAVITDPPYSSGGFTRSDRNALPSKKYCQDGDAVGRPEFTGDNRDPRSWCEWCRQWMSACLRAMRDGGYLLCFTDWRMLPTLTDAVQVAGFVWRGVISWDKGAGARAPHKGYFRHQCEYIVWASAGPLPAAEHDGPFAGSHTIPVIQSDKHHMTGKPVALMRQLVRCVPPGGLVIDPFAGSGTTGVACVETGRRFEGCESVKRYCAMARNRIASSTPSLWSDGAIEPVATPQSEVTP